MWNRLGYHVCVVCDVCAYSAKNSSGRSKEAGISLLDIERNYGKWTLFSSCFDNWQMLAYVISACEVCIIWWKLIASCRIERKLPNRRPGRSHSTNSAVCMSHKYFEDAKKQDFGNPLNLTFHAQSIPQRIGILNRVFCTSGPNLVHLAWMNDEFSHGQAQNGVNFDFKVKFDLEDQGQSPPKTIGILTKSFTPVVQIWWS